MSVGWKYLPWRRLLRACSEGVSEVEVERVKIEERPETKGGKGRGREGRVSSRAQDHPPLACSRAAACPWLFEIGKNEKVTHDHTSASPTLASRGRFLKERRGKEEMWKVSECLRGDPDFLASSEDDRARYTHLGRDPC